MGMILSAGVLGTLIWSFFNPLLASAVFLFVFVLIFEGYIYFVSRTDRPHHLKSWSDPFNLNPDEVLVVKKYHLFFKFPTASLQFSRTISAIQLSSLIWVPWLIHSRIWFSAILILINYFISERLAMQLNPRLYLSQRSKNLYASTELEAIDTAFEKFHKYDADLHKINQT